MLWENLGYLVILFPIAILTVFYDVMIMKNNVEFHTAIRNNRKRRLILLGIMVILLVEVESVYFMIDIIKIIGEQFPQSIFNKTVYDQQMFIVGTSIYGIIPIIHYYSSWTIKRWYGVKSAIDHNRFKIDILPAIPYMCIAFIGSLIGIVVYNYEIGLLKIT